MSELRTIPEGVTVVNHLNVSIVYGGKAAGNMDPRFSEADDPGADVQANRERLIEPLSPARYIVQAPVGGTEFMDISDVPDDELEAEYKTDGLFINRPDVALGLNTADCVAMAIYSKRDPVLGVIHAGRKGVLGGIHQAAARHMINAHGVAVEDMRAYLGPSIGPDSYFFPTISEQQLDDPHWQPFIIRKNGNYHVDIAGKLVGDLVELGIEDHYIGRPRIDVGADTRYFSHVRHVRTGEPKGRNGFAAMIRRD